MNKIWKFGVVDFDDNETMVDADGGSNGDSSEAFFTGDSAEAEQEGDRRADLWEERTGNFAIKVTRYSLGTPKIAAPE